jgi:hypothetical protein
MAFAQRQGLRALNEAARALGIFLQIHFPSPLWPRLRPEATPNDPDDVESTAFAVLQPM